MRPYMEDRHTIINSYEPRTSLGKAVQVSGEGGCQVPGRRWVGQAELAWG